MPLGHSERPAPALKKPWSQGSLNLKMIPLTELSRPLTVTSKTRRVNKVISLRRSCAPFYFLVLWVAVALKVSMLRHAVRNHLRNKRRILPACLPACLPGYQRPAPRKLASISSPSS